MCDFCEREDLIMSMEVDFIGGIGPIGEGGYISTDTIGVFIDTRPINHPDSTSYLRLAYLDDAQCLDHGEKVEINYCPFCGRKL